MDGCDVLIVGGGPGGSTCARTLRSAGADVVVVDKAVFPRDKVCAGWITPQVVADLPLDLEEYARGRTLQPITGFRTGVIGRDRDVATRYEQQISYGIRRCEFDHYLLERSRARVRLGESVGQIRRAGARWVLNDRIQADVLVGAGGHFCPVARLLNPGDRDAPVVAAQEAEFAIDADAAAVAVDPEVPELYFASRLNGYGWCFRKQNHLNIGLGLLDRHGCSSALRAFVTYLQSRGRIPRNMSFRWRGHAYLLSEPRARRIVDDGVLLVGDAAGLAYPQSGEGIRPAIESGMMAAAAIIRGRGRYSQDRLAPYEADLAQRFGWSTRPPTSIVPAGVGAAIGVALMRVPSFVRHVVLDRWFLRSGEPAMNLSIG